MRFGALPPVKFWSTNVHVFYRGLTVDRARTATYTHDALYRLINAGNHGVTNGLQSAVAERAYDVPYRFGDDGRQDESHLGLALCAMM